MDKGYLACRDFIIDVVIKEYIDVDVLILEESDYKSKLIEWVQKNVLNMTDAERDNMQDQINKEAGLDVDDGGIDMPDATDGITRYPQDATGGFISPDDLEGSDGVNNKGEDDGGN